MKAMSMGRILIILGILLFALGIIITYSGFFSFLRLGRLPGDISIKRENFSLYLPITTCIVLSIILTLILYLFRNR
jgi:hypothetical protein